MSKMESALRGSMIAAGTALGLVLGLGLHAEEGSAPASNAPTSQDNPDRVICKREAITGTRLTKRVCHTAREWEQMRQDAREVMQQGQTHQSNPSGT